MDELKGLFFQYCGKLLFYSYLSQICAKNKTVCSDEIIFHHMLQIEIYHGPGIEK